MTKNEQEFSKYSLELLEKYTSLTDSIGMAARKLDGIREDLVSAKIAYEENKKKFWVIYKTPISFFIIIIGIVIGLFFAGEITERRNWCTVSLKIDSGFSAEKCTKTAETFIP